VNDRDVPPDGIVRTALQLLPVPAHRGGFWAELDGRLDAASGVVRPEVQTPLVASAPSTGRLTAISSAPAEERDPASLALVPLALRRSSNAVLVAMAVAAAAVVVVAGGTLLRDRQATESVDLADQEASGEIDALLDDQQLEGTLVSMSADDEERTSEAVLAFIGALHEGDAATAWDALGPASRAQLGSQAALEARLGDLDLGAWAAAEPEQVLVTPLTSDGDDLIAIVTLVGEIEVDGVLEARADAFPIRVAEGDVLLEAFASAGQIELVVPEGLDDLAERPLVTSDDEVVLVLPEGANAPVLRLDDGSIVVCGEAPGTELVALDDLPGRRCAYQPDTGISPGDHTLTVAFMSADGGEISAESVLFEAA